MKKIIRKSTALIIALALVTGVMMSLPTVADEVAQPEIAESFTNTVVASEMNAISEYGSFQQAVGDYYSFFSGENKADNDTTRYPGIVTVRSMYPITDYNFTTLVSKVNWGGTITFAASKNGVDWESLDVVTASTGDYGENAWQGTYNNNYGTLNAADGYYYLRAYLNANNDSLPRPRFPAIKSIEYNSAVPDNEALLASTYTTKKLAKEGTVSNNGTAVLDAANSVYYEGYYAFEGADLTYSTKNVYNGSITFSSEFPITDIHIDILMSTVKATFEISKDNINWEPLKYIEIKGAEVVGSSAWGAYKYDLYAHYLASDEYKYLRVTLKENIVSVPALAYVEYNYALPDSYAVKKIPNDTDVVAASEEGTTVIAATKTNMTDCYVFRNLQDESKTKSYDGSFTFKSNAPITNFHIAFASWANTLPNVQVSKDGNVWETVEHIEIISGSGTCSWSGNRYEWYYNLLPSDEYYQIKVSLTGSDPYFPALAYVEYNYQAKSVENDVDGDGRVNILDLCQLKIKASGEMPSNITKYDIFNDGILGKKDIAKLREILLG